MVEVKWHTLFLVGETHWSALLPTDQVFIYFLDYTKSECFTSTSIPPTYEIDWQFEIFY